MDGESRSPLLTLDRFSGPLDRLLVVARAREIDLSRLSLRELVVQLVASLEQAAPLIDKADWVVMTAWLVLLRSNLLIPPGTPAQHAAEAEADLLRARLIELQRMQTLAAWLERRPQLGRDVFARGKPELFGIATAPVYEVDVIEFLWASLALFDEASDPADTTEVYRPRWRDLHSIPEARDRILRLLADTSETLPLEEFLPKAGSKAGSEIQSDLRKASGWTSTFVASLELVKQGEAVLAQEGFLAPMHLGRAPIDGAFGDE
jgi:segregation and condensation protein A